jgi:hypothetical protein
MTTMTLAWLLGLTATATPAPAPAPAASATAVPAAGAPAAPPKTHRRRARGADRDAATLSPSPGEPRFNKSTDALEREVFGDDAEPAVRRAPAAWPGDRPFPVLTPNLVSLGLGTSLMGRSFHFDAPLQSESTFGRAGAALSVESYPLARLAEPGSWLARWGVAGSFAFERGDAGVGQPGGGTLTYPAGQRRWDIDVRYALDAGDRLVIVPRLGVGASSYDVDGRAPVAPSMCAGASTQVCRPGVTVAHATLGVDVRAALTPDVALSAAAAYLPGFSVGGGAGQLGAEADASARGFSGELAVSWRIIDWLALRASLPVVRYSYSFNDAAVAYRSASETYYGVVAGATALIR